jgi:DNA-3-methyladenine glycosylase I
VAKVARFNDAKIESLMQNAGIIRNRLKIISARHKSALSLHRSTKEFSGFDYLYLGLLDLAAPSKMNGA